MLALIALIIIGAVFLYVGIRIRNRNRRLHAEGINTQALVVDFEERIEQRNTNDDHFHTTTYTYPIVRFSDEDGIEVQQRLDSTASRNLLDNYVNISYVKHQYENGETEYEIIIDTEFQRNQFPMIFIALGAVMVLVGAVRLIMYLTEGEDY